MDDPHTTEGQSHAKKKPPGIQLRKAREARGLANKDIAERLHLSEKVIEAIEKDDYDHLPVPTFVRGYLRSYSDLVGLNADLIVEKYNQYTNKGAGLPTDRDIVHKSVGGKRTGSSKNVKIEAFLALIFAVVIGVVYLTGSESTDHNSGIDSRDGKNSSGSSASSKSLDYRVGQKIADTEQSNNPYNGLARYSGEDGDLENLQDQSLKDESIEKPVRFSDAAASSEADYAIDTGLDNRPKQDPEIADDENAASSENAFDIFQDEDEDIFPEEKPVPQRALFASIEELSLEFHADAWIEVHDASGDRLLYRLGKEGRTYRVTGKAPFEVLLGNAREVTVMVNGQVFDQTPYIRGQVARFMAGTTMVTNTE